MRQCCTCSQQPAVVLRQQGVPGRGGAVGSLGILQRGKLIFPLHLERNKVSSKTQNNNAVVIIHRLPLQCCFKEQCSGRIREQWCCSCRTLFHPAMKAQNILFYFTWEKKNIEKKHIYFEAPWEREHVKNKLLHLDAVGLAGFDVVTTGVHKGNLLHSNVLLQLVLVLPVGGESTSKINAQSKKLLNSSVSHRYDTKCICLMGTIPCDLCRSHAL